MTNESRSDQYQREGFTVVEGLLPAELIESLRNRITDIGGGRVPEFPAGDIDFEPGDNGHEWSSAVRKINRCAENDTVFRNAASNFRILDIVESLIGGDIKLFGSQCFMKPPGGIEKPYHQDSAYFTIEPMSLVTCWIALDDVTVENGCMWVIPGSHRGELYDHSQPWDVGGRVDMQVPDDKIDRSCETPITMSAGSCSFHHSMLLHRSGPNQTEGHRRGLAVHYMSSQSRWTNPTVRQPRYPLLRGRKYPECV
jgi:phytanoyl-CoA hydroxylase